MAETPSTAKEEVGTGRKGVFGCDNYEIEGGATFHCSAYDSWDPNNPQTYTVPDGDFCSDLSDPTDPELPKLPNCADSDENADALTVDINDGEGTECIIDLQNPPGAQKQA